MSNLQDKVKLKSIISQIRTVMECFTFLVSVSIQFSHAFRPHTRFVHGGCGQTSAGINVANHIFHMATHMSRICPLLSVNTPFKGGLSSQLNEKEIASSSG